MRRETAVVRRTAFLTCAAMAGVVACDPGFGGDAPPRQCGFAFEGRPCVALEIQGPWGVLAGDTVRLNTASDSGYSAPVTWTVAGNGQIVPGSEQAAWTFGSSEGRSILLHAGTVGTMTVTAVHGTPSRRASAIVAVVDSSVIGHIIVYVAAFDPRTNTYAPSTTARVGDSLRLSALLYDGSNHLYAVAPNWATTDSAIAKIIDLPAETKIVPAVRWLRARAAGSVDVIASFSAAHESVHIAITP